MASEMEKTGRQMNFDNWVVRASQAGLIMTGTFGITENQKQTIAKLEEKLASGKALTDLQSIEYNSLLFKRENPELSKTTISELRKIYRQEKYGRKFMFTNKYLQKGILQEEESITLLSRHLGIPLFKNSERRTDDFFTGEPDIVPNVKVKRGRDIKSSWSLDTFPWKDDSLDSGYEWQNIVYSHLWKCDAWITDFCLVNATERMVYNEKMKYFYALGQPEPDDENYKNICREIERNMIFDVERFKRDYPSFDFDNEDLDFTIPESDRVVSFEVEFSKPRIEELKERIVECRKYLNSL